MRKMVLAMCVLIGGMVVAGGDPALRGPFPLLCTPWTADGALDVQTLVKEAEFVDSCGVAGILWPTAGEVVDLVKEGEYEKGLDALAARAAKPGFAARAASASSPFSYSPSLTRSTTSPAVGHKMPATPHESTNSASFTSVGTSSAPSAVHGVHKSGNGPRIAGSPPASRRELARTSEIDKMICFFIDIPF